MTAEDNKILEVLHKLSRRLSTYLSSQRHVDFDAMCCPFLYDLLLMLTLLNDYEQGRMANVVSDFKQVL